MWNLLIAIITVLFHAWSSINQITLIGSSGWHMKPCWYGLYCTTHSYFWKGKGSTDMSLSPAFELDMLSCSRHIYWLDVKSDNLQYNMLLCWFAGTNDSSTNHLMFQVSFFLIISCKILCKNCFNLFS